MATHSPIFLDPALDEEFATKGYFVIPLLTPEDIAALYELRSVTGRAIPSDYYATVLDPDLEYRRVINDGVERIMSPRVLPLLNGYRCCSNAFIDKRGNTSMGRVPLHQDYTFVDQSRHTGVHVWVPLVDVNEENGCLSAFPGTHSFVNHVSVIPTGPSPWDSVRGLLEAECGIRVPMKAGSAFVYNERLLHSSDENRTASERPAAAGAFIPQDARMRLYVKREGTAGTVDVMEMDHFLDVLTEYQKFKVVNADRVAQIATEEHVITPLTADQIECLRINRPPRPQAAAPAAVPEAAPAPVPAAAEQVQPAAPPKRSWFRRLFGV